MYVFLQNKNMLNLLLFFRFNFLSNVPTKLIILGHKNTSVDNNQSYPFSCSDLKTVNHHMEETENCTIKENMRFIINHQHNIDINTILPFFFVLLI